MDNKQSTVNLAHGKEKPKNLTKRYIIRTE